MPEPPTLEQCENLAGAMGFPILPPGLQPPFYVEGMRNLHGLIVRTVNGDDEAAAVLAALKNAFAFDKGRIA